LRAHRERPRSRAAEQRDELTPPHHSITSSARASSGHGTVRRVRDEAIGEFDIPGLPVKFSRWADRNEIAADRLGEHNEEVLRKLLSLTDQEIAGLYADKVIVRESAAPQ
jgi:crotonobetainyl-CoA:carnitine CoA-transferase CaiB-like acyl-CoA transferase